jgi:hypothetical protein
MSDTWSWLALPTAIIPVVLTFTLPRLFQRESRRLQLEAETLGKRLDALDKAITLVGKAKSELRIEVATDDLQNELERLLHEFASPVVRSREALEDWATETLIFRFFRTPRFSAPRIKARFVRGMRNSSFMEFFLLMFYAGLTILSLLFLNGLRWREGLIYSAFWAYLYLTSRFFILRDSKAALKALREMPKNSAEVNTPPLAVAAPT